MKINNEILNKEDKRTKGQKIKDKRQKTKDKSQNFYGDSIKIKNYQWDNNLKRFKQEK